MNYRYQMKSFRKRLRFFLVRHFYRVEKWRWVVVVIVSVGLLWVEIYEFIELAFLNQPFHVMEVVLYALLISGNGLFLELFVRLNRVHKRMTKVLEFKHNLSLELMLINDWESLAAKLAELPSRMAAVDEAHLLINNPISARYETVGHWVDNERSPTAEEWHPTIPCQKCLETVPPNSTSIHLCRNDNGTSSQYQVYSLKITNEKFPPTLLRFRLEPGFHLSPDDEKIFINIGDEIAVAIHAGQDHKRFSELHSAEVAMAERRMVSAYVHDQLGQNLGYLHLKLDQLGANESVMTSMEIRKELNHLREVANDSYEIVRDILKKIQPETIPHLTNLLKEHATRVSRMANFALKFQCTGKPIQLLPDTQQTIFYVFREILSNVEKHSKANTVDVLVTWSDSFLDISVADNGIGFEPESVRKDEHFGLQIMQERIAKLDGQLMMNSSADSGTIISISVPV